MRHLLWLLVLCLGCTPAEPPEPIRMEVYFSPHGGCTTAVVKEIQKAKRLIQVQAYSFTSPEIVDALIKAHKRINVSVIVDKSNLTDTYSAVADLAKGGVFVMVDDKHAIAHNKVMIIDSDTVVTGSFNFTKQAESRNAENVLVVHDFETAKQYTENWFRHADHSKPYEGEKHALHRTGSEGGSRKRP